jgi:hypothetical protein
VYNDLIVTKDSTSTWMEKIIKARQPVHWGSLLVVLYLGHINEDQRAVDYFPPRSILSPSPSNVPLSVEYHVDRTISIWGLASDLDTYKGP